MQLRQRIRRALVLVAVGPAVLLGAVVLYLVAAVVLGLVPLNAWNRPPDSGGVEIYLRSNGVHADLVLPMVADDVDWRSRLPLDVLPPLEGETDHLAFGWGDRGFYLHTPRWADLRATTALRALSGFDTTVLHVEATAVSFQRDPSLRGITLTTEQYRRLAAYIEGAFREDAHGAKRVISGARYGRHDVFFEARGHYSILETCNEWTRRALYVAGVRVPVWSPFDTALYFQLPIERYHDG